MNDKLIYINLIPYLFQVTSIELVYYRWWYFWHIHVPYTWTEYIQYWFSVKFQIISYTIIILPVDFLEPEGITPNSQGEASIKENHSGKLICSYRSVVWIHLRKHEHSLPLTHHVAISIDLKKIIMNDE